MHMQSILSKLANMLKTPLFTLNFNQFSMFVLVNYWKYLGWKIVTKTCTNHFMQSIVKLSTSQQYHLLHQPMLCMQAYKSLLKTMWCAIFMSIVMSTSWLTHWFFMSIMILTSLFHNYKNILSFTLQVKSINY